MENQCHWTTHGPRSVGSTEFASSGTAHRDSSGVGAGPDEPPPMGYNAVTLLVGGREDPEADPLPGGSPRMDRRRNAL